MTEPILGAGFGGLLRASLGSFEFWVLGFEFCVTTFGAPFSG